MKRLLIFLLVFVSGYANGQSMYYRIRINTDDKGLARLSSMGIAIEHGEMIKGKSYTSDFSDQELSLIKKSEIPYEILISDVSNYYVSRNKLSLKELKLQYPIWATWLCTLPATPRNFRLGSMGGFYKYEEMMAALDSMQKKFPNLISIRTPISISLNSLEGRTLQYVRISNNPNTDQQKPKILYTALHHAREPISASQMIFFMWYLLENYNSSNIVKNLLDNMEMFFIPCVNPDGYVFNQTRNPDGGGMWRKNRAKDSNGFIVGVDLNRNYDFLWGYDEAGSTSYTYGENYRGPSAFSEPEARLIKSFCTRYHFNVVINHHSFSNMLIYPWGHDLTTELPDSAMYYVKSAEMTKCNRFRYGRSSRILYLTNGAANDWMYGAVTSRPKAFSYTAETGNSVDGFWPPRERIIPLSSANVDMNMKAAQFARSLPVQ